MAGLAAVWNDSHRRTPRRAPVPQVRSEPHRRPSGIGLLAGRADLDGSGAGREPGAGSVDPGRRARHHLVRSRERWRAGWDRYWFDPVPVERVDVFARIIAAVVAFTVISKDGWAAMHADARSSSPAGAPGPRPAPAGADAHDDAGGAGAGRRRCGWMFTAGRHAAAVTTLVSYGSGCCGRSPTLRSTTTA